MDNRLQIHVRNGRVRVYTMNGADWIAAIHALLRKRLYGVAYGPGCPARLSAFAVAIGSKADMAYCTAHVCF